jgi:hypothetical protein
VRARLRTLEQLMPFATAGELIAHNHLPVVSGGAMLGVLSVRDLTGSLIERHERLLRRLHDERVTLLFPYPSSF